MDDKNKDFENEPNEDLDDLDDKEEENDSPARVHFLQIATLVLALAICALLVMIFRMRPRSENAGDAASTATESSTEVTVPDLVGKTVDEALKETEALHVGLKFRERVTSNKSEDTIVSTDPEAGETIKTNGTIEYTLSDGPDAVRLGN